MFSIAANYISWAKRWDLELYIYGHYILQAFAYCADITLRESGVPKQGMLNAKFDQRSGDPTMKRLPPLNFSLIISLPFCVPYQWWHTFTQS